MNANTAPLHTGDVNGIHREGWDWEDLAKRTDTTEGQSTETAASCLHVHLRLTCVKLPCWDAPWAGEERTQEPRTDLGLDCVL